MGLYLVIFGTKGLTYSHGRGEFNCPRCGPTPYEQKRVRRFFSLYFIPLIPLDLLGEYVECGRCGGTYKLEVLELGPDAGSANVEAEFQLAIRRVMALVVLADGVVEDSEVEAMREIYRDIAGSVLSTDEVRAEIATAKREDRTVQDYLKGVVGMLNNSSKELVVQSAVMIATADGEFQAEEKELMLSIGKALQMHYDHLNSVITATLSSDLEYRG